MRWRATLPARASLRLLLFRVDSGVRSRSISGSPHRAATLSTSPVSSRLRLDRLGDGLETDFGFEAAAVHVLAAEPLSERQERLGMDEGAPLRRASLGSSTACSSGWAPAPFASCIPTRAISLTRRASFPLSPFFTRGHGGARCRIRHE